MKLKSLKIKRAYGYLNLNVAFKSSLTFLVGINGSGKTTALRLLEGLLTPNLMLLDKVPHDSAELRIEHDKVTYRIRSSVSGGKTTVQISSLGPDEVLSYVHPDVSTPRLGTDKTSDDYKSIYAQLAENRVLDFLRNKLGTPLFLGLDRRNVALHFDEGLGDPFEARRKDMFIHSMMRKMSITGQLGSSLMDVQFLIQEMFRKSRGAQEEFVQKLRQDIFLQAFEIHEGNAFYRSLRQGKGTVTPFLTSIIQNRQNIEKALRDAGLATEVFLPAVDKFYSHIDKLAMLSSATKDDGTNPKANIEVELALNRPVVDRVMKLIQASEVYNVNLRKLWAPITEFVSLANRFLVDSNKRLEIDEVGWLYVVLPDREKRSLEILSSGERQIVVLLGHLAVNKELGKAGVFVVDEPELSLHLKWQQIFVKSLLEASPKNQFILATHSPAIVMDRGGDCRSLDRNVEIA